DVAHARQGLNRNWVTGVYIEKQYYLTHMLAVSPAFADYCTHPLMLEILEKAVGADYRLKALRYYETYGGHHMQWHTDNKTDRGFAHIPGLIFIAYVSDVADGEFLYVRGSHAWSGEKSYNDYPDELIAQQYVKDICTFKLPWV